MGNRSGQDLPDPQLGLRGLVFSRVLVLCFSAHQKLMQNVESGIQDSQPHVLIERVKSY